MLLARLFRTTQRDVQKFEASIYVVTQYGEHFSRAHPIYVRIVDSHGFAPFQIR
jgi:hypothetical protein